MLSLPSHPIPQLHDSLCPAGGCSPAAGSLCWVLWWSHGGGAHCAVPSLAVPSRNGQRAALAAAEERSRRRGCAGGSGQRGDHMLVRLGLDAAGCAREPWQGAVPAAGTLSPWPRAAGADGGSPRGSAGKGGPDDVLPAVPWPRAGALRWAFAHLLVSQGSGGAGCWRAGQGARGLGLLFLGAALGG